MVAEWLWRSVICPFTLRFHKSVLIPGLPTKAPLQSLCRLLTLDCGSLLSLRTLGSLHPRPSRALLWHGLNVWKTQRGIKVLLSDQQTELAPPCNERVNWKKAWTDSVFFKNCLGWTEWASRDMILHSRIPGAAFRIRWGWTPTCCAVLVSHPFLSILSEWNVLLVLVTTP